MNVEGMYEDFRKQFPKLVEEADAKHIEIWGSVEREATFLWFESLAAALNTQVGIPEESSNIKQVFSYFETKFRAGSTEVRNCIDVSLIENLFWDVSTKNTAAA